MPSNVYALADNLTYWEGMREKAQAGEFFIAEDVAKKLDAACVAYLTELNKMLETTKNLSNPAAFGIMQSAQDLAAKFHRLAVGEDGSARSAIKQQIEIIKTMQEMFQQYFKSIDDVDKDTAAAIVNQLPPK